MVKRLTTVSILSNATTRMQKSLSLSLIFILFLQIYNHFLFPTRKNWKNCPQQPQNYKNQSRNIAQTTTKTRIKMM